MIRSYALPFDGYDFFFFAICFAATREMQSHTLSLLIFCTLPLSESIRMAMLFLDVSMSLPLSSMNHVPLQKDKKKLPFSSVVQCMTRQTQHIYGSPHGHKIHLDNKLYIHKLKKMFHSFNLTELYPIERLLNTNGIIYYFSISLPVRVTESYYDLKGCIPQSLVEVEP